MTIGLARTAAAAGVGMCATRPFPLAVWAAVDCSGSYLNMQKMKKKSGY